MKPHSLANTSRVRHRQRMHMAARRRSKKRLSSCSKARNLAAHRSQETPVQADTRRARTQEYGEPPFRRDSQNKQVAARRERDERLYEETVVPGGQETKSERQIVEQVSVLFLLKLKSVISALSLRDKLSLGRGNMWKLRATQRSFRNWCSGGQKTRSAWLPTTLKSCREQQQELDVETVTWKSHPQVTVTWAMVRRRHRQSFSLRGHTYIGKPQLSSSVSVSSTLCSFSSQER